jgi:hypothetical protein
MGNVISNSRNVENPEKNNMDTTSLIEYIDKIATNYILKQSIVDMMRFSDKEYYDNMLLLTSYILKNHLSSLDIGLLKERVLNGNGKNVNENQEENTMIYYTNTNRLKEITFKNEKKKQKALLLISKFYIKIMTLFSAITATIDPQYVYEDENGEKKYFFLKDFDSYAQKLDKNTKQLKINQLDNPIGFVQKRLGILKNKIDHTKNENGEFVVLNPGEKICNMKDNNAEGRSLNQEIGIKELDALYYDVYDYENNKWNKKSQSMQDKYEKDLLLFYQIFTGKKDKPAHIVSFGDIESLDFHNLKRCVNGDYYQDLLVSQNDTLFQKYMEKIEQIQSITKTYKKKLLYILKKIFIPHQDEETSFIISSDLNMESLLEYQKEVQNAINQIYMNCERLFIEALILYEKMYENQHGVLTENQIKNIESKQKMETNVLDETSLEPGIATGVTTGLINGINQRDQTNIALNTNAVMTPGNSMEQASITPIFTPSPINDGKQLVNDSEPLATTPMLSTPVANGTEPVPTTPMLSTPVANGTEPVPSTSTNTPTISLTDENKSVSTSSVLPGSGAIQEKIQNQSSLNSAFTETPVFTPIETPSTPMETPPTPIETPPTPMETPPEYTPMESPTPIIKNTVETPNKTNNQISSESNNVLNTQPKPMEQTEQQADQPQPDQPQPEPVTPESVTPEPVTPEPVTPEPVTPEPVTPEPQTDQPESQAEPQAESQPESQPDQSQPEPQPEPDQSQEDQPEVKQPQSEPDTPEVNPNQPIQNKIPNSMGVQENTIKSKVVKPIEDEKKNDDTPQPSKEETLIGGKKALFDELKDGLKNLFNS